MKRKYSSKIKIFVAVSMLALFVFVAVVSVILVLAANSQSVKTNISVAYIASGVGAKVSANYSIIPNNTEKEIEIIPMVTSQGLDYIEFQNTDVENLQEIKPQSDIVLSTKKQHVIFEYIFENIADSSFTIQLIEELTSINISSFYYVSGEKIPVNNYRNLINNNPFEQGMPQIQQMTTFGQKIYIYALIKIEDESLEAECEGDFTWVLSSQQATTT